MGRKASGGGKAVSEIVSGAEFPKVVCFVVLISNHWICPTQQYQGR